jgi:peptidoglycan/xylan/chitin deacetylase (PgdA/CDA1 family)
MSLRSTARESIAHLLRWSGAPWLLRRAHRRNAASILFYHDPKPAVLDAHLAYLRDRYSFTTLDAIVDAMERRDASALPDHAVALTFDDGHRGNHALLPVFRRHGVVPTIYLCSQIVGTGRRFWFQIPGMDADLYKPLPAAERLAALARDHGFDLLREYPAAERQALSDREIEEMAPHVDFQVHTRFHPVLPHCTDEEAWEEIAVAKRELEERLGRPCRHFSYPNGDYVARDAELVRRAGFASARTTELGWTRLDTDPFRLPCFGITDDASVAVLAAQLSGIPSFVRRRTVGIHNPGAWQPPASD